MDERKRACAICGKLFVPKAGNSRFCGPDCKREKAIERARMRTIEKQKKKTASDQIVDMAKEAKANGMSYGQYVAMLYVKGERDERFKTG